jgi:AcrR family transcriptional regulator
MTPAAQLPDTPSARIVAEIDRRISSGELQIGDRVPSTRQIIAEFGVAMATATKALTTLRQQGRVHTVPGVGTMVGLAPTARADRQRPEGEPAAVATAIRTGAREQPLSRERVVRAAVVIADTEGLGALSMRRVATELGTATMSLYRHVRNKDELLLLMVDHVFVRYPVPPNGLGWRAGLEALCRLQWQGYTEHAWLAQYMSMTRPQLVPRAMAHTEWALAQLSRLGLDPNTRLHVAVTLANYVRGTAVNLEPEAIAEQDSGITSDEWMETQSAAMTAIVQSGEFPMFGEVFRDEALELDLDSLFDFGLKRMLDGIAVLVDANATTQDG